MSMGQSCIVSQKLKYDTYLVHFKIYSKVYDDLPCLFQHQTIDSNRQCKRSSKWRVPMPDNRETKNVNLVRSMQVHLYLTKIYLQ